MIVETWMTKQPLVVAPETTIGEAAAAMMKGGFRHLPVVRDGVLLGIISRSDLLRGREIDPFAAGNRESTALRTEIQHVMTASPVTVAPTTPLEEAAALLVARKIGALPVVRENGLLVGILTESDAMRALIESIEMPGPGVRLTFDTTKPDALIAFLVDHAAKLHLHIVSLMVRHVSGGIEVLVKVRGAQGDKLVDAAWGAGHRLRNVTRGHP
ncbi:MAG: CBS domain-containing protein [Deltaproteobacteria bacterium]|nr:CBS domain-containing protein [Deltaproteobacteria bacterium]